MLSARVGNLTLLSSVHSGIVFVAVEMARDDADADDGGGKDVVKSREIMVPRMTDLRSGSDASSCSAMLREDKVSIDEDAL